MDEVRSVLVIDDDPDIAEIVCATAESLGRTCVVTSTAKQFLAALTPRTSLILMDLRMPEVNGDRLMQQLAQQHCAAEIVLMSGAGRADMAAAESLGLALGLKIAGLLAKPFRGAELRAVLMQSAQN